MDQEDTRIVHLGIAFSHYVEKTRWGLAYYGIKYEDEPVMPGAHLPKAKKYTKYMTQEDIRERRPKQSPTETPILVEYNSAGTDVRKVVQGSQRILEYLSRNYSSADRPNLYQACGVDQALRVTQLEQKYDAELGVAARAMVYYDILVANWWHAMIPWAFLGFRYPISLFHSVLWTLGSPLFRYLLIRAFKLYPQNYKTHKETTRRIFWEASELLEQSPYLAGNSFSAADLAFASLAYPAVGVTYEEGYTYATPPTKMFSSELRSFHQEMRATKAGQHVLKMFAQKKALCEAPPRRSKVM